MSPDSSRYRFSVADDPSLLSLRIHRSSIPQYLPLIVTDSIHLQWEDPAVDLQHLNLTKDDSILCITSAG